MKPSIQFLWNRRLGACLPATFLPLVLTTALCGQAPVSIENPGFETPTLDDGKLNNKVVPGWTAFNGGDIDILNPTTSDLSAGAPEGENVATILSSSAEDGLSQTLTSTFQAEASYDFSVKVANTLFTTGFPGYRVQLLAGGAVLIEEDNTQAVAEDGVITVSLSYNYDDVAHGALVGQPLEIRLLSKGASPNQEIAFDDVRLGVALANPAANPGGPYYVPKDGSLALDGSASLPSDGQTLTTWEWDLDNDGEFDDATGAMPSAITDAELMSLYGMTVGANTIGLRVTDDTSPTPKTGTAAGIVTLAPPMAGQLGILDLQANGGINPATGEQWKPGDQYRLVFHTSESTTAESSDITTYDAWVQGLANASTAYGIAADDGALWRVIGSTNELDARDHTWTNPTNPEDGDGHPIYLLDGATMVATDFNDLWDGEVAHIIDLTEIGTKWAFWPFTGTYRDGTTASGKGQSFAGLGGGGQINQGQAGVTTNWIWRQWTADPPTTNLPMYAMTLPLTVVDLTDETAPGLVSIEDDVSGGPVEVPVILNYTVTFDEPMAAGKVGVDDFENALATPISIDRVNPTKDPTVFEVVVSVPTPGDVQLQLKAGAVLTDLTGNDLETSSAIPDDTVITVLPETTPPMVDTLAPENGATGLTPVATLTITYIEESEMMVGSGSIRIFDANDDATPLHTLDVTGPNVSLDGLEVTVTLPSYLPFGTDFYVNIDAGAFKDTSDNGTVAIDDETTWAFSTVPLPAADGPISILTATAAGEAVPFDTDGTDLVHAFDTYPRLSADHLPVNGSDIQMSAGHHLVIYSSRFDSTGGSNRSEVQSKLRLNGADLAAGWAQGYIRRQNGQDETITSGGGIIHVATAGELLQLRSFRTDSNGGETAIRADGNTGIQLLKLDDSWNYLSLAGHDGSGTDQTLPADDTTWSSIEYQQQAEVDAGSFGYTLDPGVASDITLVEPGHYLVFANTYVTGAAERSAMLQRLTLDGDEIVGSKTNVYLRGSGQNSCEDGSATIGMIIETLNANQVLRVEARQSDNDGTLTVVGPRTGLTMVKLPDTASFVRLADLDGQDVNAVGQLAFDDAGSQLEVGSAFFHDTAANPSRVGVNTPGDYLFFSSFFVPSDGTARAFPNLGWQVNGTGGLAAHGQTGRYSRDTGPPEAGNWCGFMTGLAASDHVEVLTQPLGAEGPNVASVLALQGVNVDSLFGGTPPTNNFSDWIAGYDVGALTGFDDDPDGDGHANGIENYFGTDPSVFTAGVGEVAVSGNTVTFSHPLNDNPADDVSASYAWSTDLGTFFPDGSDNGSGTTVVFVQGTPSGGMVEVTGTITGPAPPRLFIRLEAFQAVP